MLGGLTEDGVASDGWILGREADAAAFGKTGSLAILSISAFMRSIANPMLQSLSRLNMNSLRLPSLPNSLSTPNMLGSRAMGATSAAAPSLGIVGLIGSVTCLADGSAK